MLQVRAQKEQADERVGAHVAKISPQVRHVLEPEAIRYLCAAVLEVGESIKVEGFYVRCRPEKWEDCIQFKLFAVIPEQYIESYNKSLQSRQRRRWAEGVGDGIRVPQALQSLKVGTKAC